MTLLGTLGSFFYDPSLMLLSTLKLCVQNCRMKMSLQIDRIRSDYGKEFENSYMKSFCIRLGISQEFSAPITPQQNGVVERKNRVI